ncbi:MAG: DUF4157 domain-containing protein [Myxococcales bacterium]|nr:DUF4157 domain-containing protein [Myxococcales bacterium]
MSRRANDGLAGATPGFPHFDTLRQAFGPFDLSGVRSSSDHRATQATNSLGANAFATPAGVAFSGTPDLRTAAHEATHVIQQRHGQRPEGGVGARGDRFERDAERVADVVGSGGSAAPLLAEMIGQHASPALGPSAGGGAEAVQFEAKPDAQPSAGPEAQGGGKDAGGRKTATFPTGGITENMQLADAQTWAESNLPPTLVGQFMNDCARGIGPLVERRAALKETVFAGGNQDASREYSALAQRIENMFADLREAYEPDVKTREQSAALAQHGDGGTALSDPEVYRLLAEERRYAAGSLPPELADKHYQQCVQRAQEVSGKRTQLRAGDDALSAGGQLGAAAKARMERGQMLFELKEELARIRDQNTPGFEEREKQRQIDATAMQAPPGTTPADIAAARADEERWNDIFMEMSRQDQIQEVLTNSYLEKHRSGPGKDPETTEELFAKWHGVGQRKQAAERAYLRAKKKRLYLSGQLTPAEAASMDRQMERVTADFELHNERFRESRAKSQSQT